MRLVRRVLMSAILGFIATTEVSKANEIDCFAPMYCELPTYTHDLKFRFENPYKEDVNVTVRISPSYTSGEFGESTYNLEGEDFEKWTWLVTVNRIKRYIQFEVEQNPVSGEAYNIGIDVWLRRNSSEEWVPVLSY